MERGDDQPLAHVETMRVDALYAGIKIEQLAVGLPRPSGELGEERPSNALATPTLCRHEIVDVKLPHGDSSDNHPPTGHPHATVLIVGSRESQPLSVPLVVQGGKGLSGETGPQLAKDRKHVSIKPRVTRIQINHAHAEMVACGSSPLSQLANLGPPLGMPSAASVLEGVERQPLHHLRIRQLRQHRRGDDDLPVPASGADDDPVPAHDAPIDPQR